MEWWELLFFVNLVCVGISANFAKECFDEGNQVGGWLNVFASALNAGIFLNHFVTL